MTKIVCFSDLHGQISKKLTASFLEEAGDILIFAGDLQVNSSDNGKTFLNWIDQFNFKHKLIVLGNHDCNYMEMLEHSKNYNNVKILFNESIVIDGIKIFGSPNTLPFMNWCFMKTEEELAEIYATIPDDTNILVTHTPAFGILDSTNNNSMVGSKSLLVRIGQLLNLKYHICGHVHEGYGSRNIEGFKTQFLNVSLLDEHYKLRNSPILINYSKYGLWDVFLDYPLSKISEEKENN